MTKKEEKRGEEMVILKNVSKTYSNGSNQVKALSNVNLEIDSGKFTVILGPSGSGKSTLLNILGGMDNVTVGDVYLDDQNISNYKGGELTNYRRRDIGFVFQFYNLIPSLTAIENIGIASKLGKQGFSPEEMLAAVGLEERGRHFPAELSGGEMQRISIARALCKNPKLLLCDEPTGALDSKTGVKILELLKEMSIKHNKTVIIVTHNALIADIADKVIKLKDGVVDAIIDNENPLKVEEVNW